MKRLILCVVFPVLALMQACTMTEDLHLTDRAEISQQVSRYAQLWDRKDADTFATLFAEDGVMEWRFAGTPDDRPVVAGWAEIQRYAKHAFETRLAGKQSRHHFTGLVFEDLSGTDAVTEHNLLVTHTIATERPSLVSSGVYRITWRKTEEGWLISHRTLFVDR
ncbi:MAG: nuclear transport factor 2 family protein [Henriciella sp.]|nr:nuclear transport factor 2 family protein [Henriciella sp.]